MDFTLALLSFLLGIILSSFILIKGYTNPVSRYFSIFVLFVGVYSFLNHLAVSAESDSEAMIWGRFVMLSLVPIGPFFFLFAYSFTQDAEKISKKILQFLFVGMAIQIPLILSNFTISSISISSSGIVIKPGLGMALFLPMHLGSFLFGAIILINKYRLSQGLFRTQLRLIIFGVLSGIFLTIIVTVFFGVLFGYTNFLSLSPLFLLSSASFTAYAILKHRFLDIRLIVVRSLAYIFLLLFIAMGYMAILFNFAFFFGRTRPTIDTFFGYIGPSILAIFFAVTFQPLKRFFERVTSRLFYRDRYDATELLWGMSRVMASTLDLHVLTQGILSRLLEKMHVSYAVVVLIKDKTIFRVESAGAVSKHPFRTSDMYRVIHNSYHQTAHNEHIFVFEELPEGEMKQILRDHELSVILPLTVHKELIGGLVLGEKQSGEMYSEEDISVLHILAPEIAVAIKNALSYEEIRKFTITLKHEVERATIRLRKANHRLKELDVLKDEFVSIASHELRTPMTAVKSYLWMAMHQANQEIRDPLKKYLEISYKSTERLIRLVNEMLTVSRIERKKIELVMTRFNILDVVRPVYEELKITADEKHITFTQRAGEGELEVLGDRDKIREVIQNIVGNALKFTPEGGSIHIYSSVRGSHVLVSVTDTASGIPKDAQKELFKKFSKINYSYSKHSSQPGSGLGLYISKQIVSLHGGDITVQSEVGKGSTFTVILPNVASPRADSISHI